VVCNGLDDDCNGAVDDTLVGCVPPDAGPPDAGPPDAGPPVEDASIPPADAGPRCTRSDCDPFILSGRAGPIGRCGCRVGGRPDLPPFTGAMLLALGLALALRRRRG
jgi:MYXO-CTERM domain-containing protein